jgi:hypothetical protein
MRESGLCGREKRSLMVGCNLNGSRWRDKLMPVVAWRIAVVKVMRKSGAARERGHSNPSPPKLTLSSSQDAKVDLKALIVAVMPLYCLSETINLFYFWFLCVFNKLIIFSVS